MHPMGAQRYFLYEFEGVQGGPPGMIIYICILIYICTYIAPIKAWWMQIYTYEVSSSCRSMTDTIVRGKRRHEFQLNEIMGHEQHLVRAACGDQYSERARVRGR